MLSLEDLADLGSALRRADFKPSTQQTLAAQQLLLHLAGHGALPAERIALAGLLAPIYCTSALEQQQFERLYAQWLQRRFGERLAAPAPTPQPQLVPPPPGIRQWVMVLAIAVALGALTWQYSGLGQWLRSRWAPPPVAAQTAQTPAPGATAQRAPTKPEAQPLPVPVTGPRQVADFDLSATFPPRPWWHRIEWRNLVWALLPLLLYGAWALRRLSRRPVLQRLASRTPPTLREVFLPGGLKLLLPTLPLRRLAQELRRRRAVDSSELQVEPTIQATLQAGGVFSPVRGSRVEPEYLALIDRATVSDHQAMLCAELVAELARADVLIERFDFHGDATVCRPQSAFTSSAAAAATTLGTGTSARARPVAEAVELAALHERHPEHRVLVLGDGAGCFDGFTGEPKPWLVTLLLWTAPMLLTPTPLERWGRREWALQRLGVQVLPLTRSGLLALMQWLAAGRVEASGKPPAANALPLHERSPRRWLERDPPSEDTIARLCDDLTAALGQSGFTWLAACAAYPEIHWGITLRLGTGLLDSAAELERLLPRLSRLVWFRQAYMPDWLRQALIERLGPADEARTRQLLQAMLLALAAGNTDQKKGDIPLRIALGEPLSELNWWQLRLQAWRNRSLAARTRQMVRSAPPDSPLRDHVFLRFLSGRQLRRLDLSAPGALLRLLRAGPVIVEGKALIGACVATVLVLGWLPMWDRLVTTDGRPPGARIQSVSFDLGDQTATVKLINDWKVDDEVAFVRLLAAAPGETGWTQTPSTGAVDGVSTLYRTATGDRELSRDISAKEGSLWVDKPTGERKVFFVDENGVLSWTPDLQKVAVLHFNNLQLYDAQDFAQRWELAYGQEASVDDRSAWLRRFGLVPAPHLRISADGKRLLVQTNTRSTTLYDTVSRQALSTVQWTPEELSSLVFSSDLAVAALIGPDDVQLLTNTPERRPLARLPLAQLKRADVSLATGGRTVAVAQGARLALWSVPLPDPGPAAEPGFEAIPSAAPAAASPELAALFRDTRFEVFMCETSGEAGRLTGLKVAQVLRREGAKSIKLTPLNEQLRRNTFVPLDRLFQIRVSRDQTDEMVIAKRLLADASFVAKEPWTIVPVRQDSKRYISLAVCPAAQAGAAAPTAAPAPSAAAPQAVEPARAAIEGTASYRSLLAASNPASRNKRLFISGFRVRHGEIVDALAPVFTEQLADGRLGEVFESPLVGGTGGSVTTVSRSGYYVRALEVQRGQWDNIQTLVTLKVVWAALPVAPNATQPPAISATTFGTGKNAELTSKPSTVAAELNFGLSDLLVSTSRNGAGNLFLGNLSSAGQALALAAVPETASPAGGKWPVPAEPTTPGAAAAQQNTAAAEALATLPQAGQPQGIQPQAAGQAAGNLLPSALQSTLGALQASQPQVKGKRLVLVGLRVNHGWIVDGVAPIYAELLPDGSLGTEYGAGLVGGGGGDPEVVRQPGSLISALEVQTGIFEGVPVVAKLQVTFRRAGAANPARQTAPTAPTAPLTFGQARQVSKLSAPKRLEAGDDAVISDLRLSSVLNANAKPYLSDLAISVQRLEQPVPAARPAPPNSSVQQRPISIK